MKVTWKRARPGLYYAFEAGAEAEGRVAEVERGGETRLWYAYTWLYTDRGAFRRTTLRDAKKAVEVLLRG